MTENESSLSDAEMAKKTQNFVENGIKPDPIPPAIKSRTEELARRAVAENLGPNLNSDQVKKIDGDFKAIMQGGSTKEA